MIRFAFKTVSRVIALALAVIIAILAVTFVNDYYKADESALCCTYEEMEDGSLVCRPENAVAGLIFYPGAKVEHTAYLPLMETLAERGILSVIIKMPLRLAFLDVNAADGIPEMFPEIDRWYIGGHSLGGSMAASYLEGHPELSGIILLASYSTADITDSRALSIYGTEDEVLNHAQYLINKINLPKDLTEVVIQGGNHAYFGHYGEQNGDGAATIERSLQIELTADAISEFIKK